MFFDGIDVQIFCPNVFVVVCCSVVFYGLIFNKDGCGRHQKDSTALLPDSLCRPHGLSNHQLVPAGSHFWE